MTISFAKKKKEPLGRRRIPRRLSPSHKGRRS